MELSEALDLFIRIRPGLEKLERGVAGAMKETLRQQRIGAAQVTSRVKTPGSFAAKVYARGAEYQPDPVARMRDKVGVRLEVLHLGDLPTICEAVRTSLGEIEILNEEEKHAELGVTGLGYQGTHFDLLPHALLDGIDAEYAVVELQVRTMAQGVWAQANHEIDYKSPIVLDDHLKRRMVRMTALMEMFDEEVRDVRTKVITDGRYPLARLLTVIDGIRARHGRAATGQPDLTREMVQVLLGDNIDPVRVATEIEEWADEQEPRLAAIFEAYSETGRQVFVDRPEGLLAFFLIDRRKFDVTENWWQSGAHEFVILEGLALAWGDPIPQPS